MRDFKGEFLRQFNSGFLESDQLFWREYALIFLHNVARDILRSLAVSVLFHLLFSREARIFTLWGLLSIGMALKASGNISLLPLLSMETGRSCG